jgi:hypothetical protein
VAGESGPVAAGPFHTSTPYGAEAFRPTEELPVAFGGGGHLDLAQASLPRGSRTTPTWKSRCVSTPNTTSATSPDPGVPLVVTVPTPSALAASCSARCEAEDGRYCEGPRGAGKLLLGHAPVLGGSGRRPEDRPMGHLKGTFFSVQRMDGSGRSGVPPATTYSVFTADGRSPGWRERAGSRGRRPCATLSAPLYSYSFPPRQPGHPPLATSRHDATYPRPAHRRKGYSPKCLDATFSEGRRFLGALEHIHSPRIGVWCLRCVASGRRVKAQDSYLPTF